MQKGNSKIKSNTFDLTKGKPLRVILHFALPLLGGVLFQQLYNTVDASIVGRMLGINALAAVGSTSSISYMIIGFCTGSATGFTIPVARLFGAGDSKGLKHFVYHIRIMTAILALFATALFCCLCRPLLVWMGTPSDIIDMAWQYLFVIYLGIPATLLFNTCSALLRAVGNSHVPVYILTLSGLLNIVLDFLFVPFLGVSGAALATVIAQLVSGCVCYVILRKGYSLLHPSENEKQFSFRTLRELLRMGIPMGLQCSITSIGTVLVQSSVNALGSMYVAAFSGGCKLYYILCSIPDTLGTTMATYCGQNHGARRYDRIRSGVFQTLLIGFGYSLLSFLLMFFFADKIALIFISSAETEILALVRRFICIYTAFFPFLVLVFVLRSSIQGLSRSSLAMNAGLFEMVARVFLALFVIPAVGYIGVCFGGPFAWFAASCFLIPGFLITVKKLERS